MNDDLDQPTTRLAEALNQLTSFEEIKAFLDDLCTPQEIESLANRWLVAQQIHQGKPYRQIHQETGVSVTTIGRIARCIHYGAGGYEQLLNRIMN
jgi:TrpR-related protein YerC/YecD